MIVSNLIGAFASLPASKTDRLGRANVIIYGLLIVGLLVAVGVPLHPRMAASPSSSPPWDWSRGPSWWPRRPWSVTSAPRSGRASAMGFWTVGPVAGSLITSIVAANTLDHFLAAPITGWKSQFVISGVTSLVVFVICLVLMKDLSAKLRDQLMVSAQDQALVEARALGISERGGAAGHHRPWQQILKWDLAVSSFGIAIFLLVYYAASSFFTIYYSTVFVNPNGLNFSVAQANRLNSGSGRPTPWPSSSFGVLSDMLKVRKPFMLVGAIGAIVTLIVFLDQATHRPHRLLHAGRHRGRPRRLPLLAYAPWMAGYTEMVEAKNPALVGTGLALWGWILRLVVGISFIFLPAGHHLGEPDRGQPAGGHPDHPGTPYSAQTFQAAHPASVAFAQEHAAFLGVLNEPQNASAVAALAAVRPPPTWPVWPG